MSQERSFLGAAIVLILFAVLAFRPTATPGPATRDFEAYWSAGATWNAGVDPYGRGIWEWERRVPGVDAARDEMLPFVGPPATLLVWSAAARLPYRAAATVWWIVLALSLLALIALVTRASGARFDLRYALASGAMAVGFGPVTSDLALGQIALVAALGACAFVAMRKRVAAALVASLQPNAALGLISQLGANAATAALAAGGACAYLVGALAAGWSWPASYARLLAAHAMAERFSAIQFSPASIAFGLGLSRGEAAAAAAVIAAGAVVAGVLLWKRVDDGFARFAAFSALSPFVAGFFHEQDFVVAYVPAIWCAIRTRGSVRWLALAATLLVSIDWLGLAQRPTGVTQSALLAGAVFCAFAAIGAAQAVALDRGAYAVAASMALLFAAAAWLAHAHPAPVWPDALGRFHAGAALSASRVWESEQRRCGLLAPVVAWALLRCLPLLGCAALGAAIYRHPSSRRRASAFPDGSR